MTVALLALILAYPIMLIAGAVHHDVDPGVPALSYWATVIIVFIVEVVAVAAHESVKQQDAE